MPEDITDYLPNCTFTLNGSIMANTEYLCDVHIDIINWVYRDCQSETENESKDDKTYKMRQRALRAKNNRIKKVRKLCQKILKKINTNRI